MSDVALTPTSHGVPPKPSGTLRPLVMRRRPPAVASNDSSVSSTEVPGQGGTDVMIPTSMPAVGPARWVSRAGKSPSPAALPVTRGGMKPLTIWLVPGGEGLTHPMRTPSPRREGHSVDPFGSASTISASAIGAMRMKSRSAGDKDSAAETADAKGPGDRKAERLQLLQPLGRVGRWPRGGQATRRRSMAGINPYRLYPGPGSRPQPTEGRRDPGTPLARPTER